jgi:two-component system, NtrC family, sensor kinase
MQRRGGKVQPKKGRPRSANKTKTAKVPTAREQRLNRQTRELEDAHRQLAATSEVLSIIRRSPANAQPVFEAIVESAARLCGAIFSVVYLHENEHLRAAAMKNFTIAAANQINDRQELRQINRSYVGGRAFLDRRTVHITDVLKDLEYSRDFALAGGWRAVLAVPLLHEGKAIGVISVGKAEPKAFSEQQIQLLQTFADQAVIAIENTRLLSELRQRTDDLSESLEQQTATSEVLKVISASPGNLEPVFQAILESATQICEAGFGNLNLFADGVYRSVALHNPPPQFQTRLGEIIHPHPDSGLAQVARTKQIAHIEDIKTQKPYLEGNPAVVGLADLAGARTLLIVPMLNNNILVGSISIYRQEVRLFTDKQIALLQNFAAQAVIAIENARLLNELRESLRQQTATADVLKAISSSPGDLEPVFQAMLEKATQLCEAKFGIMFRYADDVFRATSWIGDVPAHTIEHPHVVSENPHNLLTRIVSTKRPAYSADLTKEPAYIEGNPRYVALVDGVGARSLLVVPMLKNEELIGAIAIYWHEARVFTDKQMELISNFAAQAVIAINNARLLSELRESLQQQTATADVLKVISRSTFDLQTVLYTLVESATRLCEADHSWMFERKGSIFSWVAGYGHDASTNARTKAYFEEHPVGVDGGSITGRAVLGGKVVHVADVLTDPDYTWGGAQKIGGYRAGLAVPLWRKDEVVGVIFVGRTKPLPFSAKQIELVTTFGDQAVIAIENTRLLNELRESLQQQTATADVLKTISRSTFDLQTVLHTLVASAARLCDADKGTITRQKDGNTFYRAESYGFSQEFMNYVRDIPIQVQRGSASGRALLEGKIVHIHDVKADPEYTFVEAQRLGDFRTILAVPMLREDVPVGVLTLTRAEVRSFTERQIELVSIFADQAAIAIENVRLFESVEARTRELAKSLEELRSTQDRLVQTQKLASLGQLTAGIAHEIKNPLNFVNNFSGVSAELIDELQEVLKGLRIGQKAKTEINELSEMLRSNLDKVVQHGKRADAIVKNMLLHSREGSGEHRVVDINALVEESLNLAYHGARAEKQGFNVALERSLDPAVGEAEVFPQDLTRALLNFISNGFYAVTKRRVETDGGNYEPTVAAATKNFGDRVEITIRDNGTGIPPDVKEKMFNPFFTTKPAGEGTGLGLSLSHDIIVKQHGGSIEVETKPGEFTEIRVILPRAASLLPERS